MAGKQEMRYEQLSAGQTLIHSEDGTVHRQLSAVHEEEHDQPQKKSGVLNKVKEKAKKWKNSLTKKSHSPSGNVERSVSDLSLEEDEVEVESEAEFHGAPMYESEVIPGGKETVPATHAATGAPIGHINEQRVDQLATNVRSTRPNEPDPEYHGAPMYESEKSPIVYKEAAPPPMSATQFPSAQNEAGAHQLPVPIKDSSSHQFAKSHTEPTMSPMSAIQFSNARAEEPAAQQQPVANKHSSLLGEFNKESTSPTMFSAQFSPAHVNEPGVHQLSATNKDLSQHNFGEFRNDSALSSGSTTQYSNPFVAEPGAYQFPTENKDASLHQFSEIQNDPALSSLSASQFSNAHVSEPGVHQHSIANKDSSLHSGEIQHEHEHEPELVRQNSFKESWDSNSPLVIAAKNAATAEAEREQENATGESNNSKSLTGTVTEMLAPAYNAVSGVTDKITSKIHGSSIGHESGAKQEYNGGVSPREYVMNKLEPGAEDRALSQVFTEAVRPNDSAKSQQTGVVERVKGAISSLVGNENVKGTSSIPASSNMHSGEAEQIGERRLQYNN